MNDTQSLGVSRRTLAKGAAWTVPAVAVVAAAPAYAKSGEPVVPSYTPGSFCNHPGNPKYYHARFCFKNTSDTAITVTFVRMNVNGENRDVVQPLTLEIAARKECCSNVDAGLFANSANGYATLYFRYVYMGQTINGTVRTTDNNNIPPCHTVGQPKDDPNPPNDTAHMLRQCSDIAS